MPVPLDLSVLHLLDIFNLVKAPAQSLKKILIVNGYREVSEFRMKFSDTLYQVGDHYKLKVFSSDTYERTLNFIVVP